MDTERSAVVNIGGEEHRLILTTKATKEIAARYGGLENLGGVSKLGILCLWRFRGFAPKNPTTFEKVDETFVF